jgi:murein DD-endopeptidase MepM/ murein hydrolase activator NlpD
MPESRARFAMSLRRRLPALLTGMTLVGSAAVERSTIERVHHHRDHMPLRRVRAGGRAPAVAPQPPSLATPVDTPAPSDREIAGMDVCAVSVPAMSVATSDFGFTAGRTWIAAIVPALWPVLGLVTSPFGWRFAPGGTERKWHRGIDIGAPYGAPVVATAEGVVAFAGHVNGYGALVIIDHGAVSTWYAHLSRIAVRRTQAIVRGQAVGAVGASGHTTGPHLHYEIRFDGRAVDPECVLAGSRAPNGRGGDQRSDDCLLTVARLEHAGSSMAASEAAKRRAGAVGG